MLDADILRDKTKGVIFGTALGDGVGLATEFMVKECAKILYGNGPIKFGSAQGYEFWRDSHRRRWHKNDFTDDTDQLLLILQCLLHSKGNLIPQHFAYRLKEWEQIGFPEMEGKMCCGIGLTVGSTSSHPDFLTNPHKASFNVWNSRDRNLAANGAVMRTGVLGIPFFWNEDKVVENAIKCAKVTHADPRCVFSSVVVSVIIARILQQNLAELARHKQSQNAERKRIMIDLMELGCISDAPLEQVVETLEPKPIYVHAQGSKTSLLNRMQNMFSKKQEDAFYKQYPTFPIHKETDKNRLKNPVKLKQNACNNFSPDSEWENLTKEVIADYTFLLNSSQLLCTQEIGDNWKQDLEKYCMNLSTKQLEDLQLSERSSIGYTFKCLGSALLSFTRQVPDETSKGKFFEKVITDLTLEAGDADTNCAVAGALLGARLGYNGLPKKWLDGLRHSAFLMELCDQMCEMVLKSFDE